METEYDRKKMLKIGGVNCPDCLGKIEKKIVSMDEIESASMNVIDKVLTINIKSDIDCDDTLAKVEKTIKKTEREASVRVVTSNSTNDDQDESSENNKLRRKLIYGIIGIIFFVLALIIREPYLVQLGLYIVAFIFIGLDVVLKAVRNIFTGKVFDENFLMSIATIGAFCVGEFSEAVLVILLYKIGQFLEEKAINKSRKSIKALMDIRPDYANLKVGDDVKKVSPDDVQIDDFILVKPGERVPLDGKVVDGISSVDTKAITGESVPRNIESGDSIYSGFINGSGLLTIKVEKIFAESTVNRILELVQNASSKKSQTESFFTKFARIYTPIVVGAAVIIAIVPPLLLSGSTFQEWIYRALIFLVISCPCALVISIPLTFFGGIGAASREGILIKGSNYIEALNSVKTIVFDKTGTLTKGVFKVTKVVVDNGFTDNEILELASIAETFSNHPIATSIKEAYSERQKDNNVQGENDNKVLLKYSELSGMGVYGEVDGLVLLCGNRKLLEKYNIEYTKSYEVGTIVYIALDNKFVGHLVISDELKTDSVKAIETLHKMGIRRTVLLSGDNESVVKATADILGIDEVHGGLLPNEKVDEFEKIKAASNSNDKVMFVGDGINDAPVISLADIGVAMGGLGADAAIESADIVLMNDEPSKISTAIRIAKKTKAIVYQNITFALVVKVFFLALAAFGYANMWEAIIADVGVLLIVVFNSTRILINRF